MTRSMRLLVVVGVVFVAGIAALAAAQQPRTASAPLGSAAVPSALLGAAATISTTAPTPGVTPVPTGLARFEGTGWHLDYPAAWSRYPGMPSRYSATIGILTSQPVDTKTACETIDPTVYCDPEHVHLAPGAVLMWITIQGTGPFLIDPVEKWTAPSYGSPATLDGAPAVFSEADGGDGQEIDWTVTDPGNAFGAIELHFELVTPVEAVARDLAAAIVSSFAFDPPVRSLDPAEAGAVVTATLAELKQEEPGYDCFPGVPGTEHATTVTVIGGYELTHALPVRCTTSIETTPIGFWRVRFVARWETTAGGPKGSMTVTIWVNSNGGTAGYINDHSGPPYCCR
ncbi:MAG TPA: hypothetical protein VGM49_07145 [Candidatus Limnocylindrales bacterium]|jgi:hypothetical protein